MVRYHPDIVLGLQCSSSDAQDTHNHACSGSDLTNFVTWRHFFVLIRVPYFSSGRRHVFCTQGSILKNCLRHTVFWSILWTRVLYFCLGNHVLFVWNSPFLYCAWTVFCLGNSPCIHYLITSITKPRFGWALTLVLVTHIHCQWLHCLTNFSDWTPPPPIIFTHTPILPVFEHIIINPSPWDPSLSWPWHNLGQPFLTYRTSHPLYCFHIRNVRGIPGFDQSWRTPKLLINQTVTYTSLFKISM